MLLAQGQIYAQKMAFDVPIGCIRFAGYYVKMYSRHIFRTVDLRCILALHYQIQY